MAGLLGLSVQHTAARRNNRVTECGESCTGDQIKDRQSGLNAKRQETQMRIWQ
jgi:hypothetical protein